jgi:hypothetical protein
LWGAAGVGGNARGGQPVAGTVDGRARRSTTNATAIYLLWWFDCPEVARLKSGREGACALEPFLGENRTSAGANREEWIRQLANRLGLSFKAKPARRRQPAASA